MKGFYFFIPILLFAGCTPVPPQWESVQRQAAEARLQNAVTQLEMNAAAAMLAENAEERMIAALEYKLGTLQTKEERLALLLNQLQWQRWVERRNQEPITDGSIEPLLQRGRAEARLKNRFLELTVPEEVRQAFLAMEDAPIRFHDECISLNCGELDLLIPAEPDEEYIPVFETIGQLCIPFCRVVKSAENVYWIGVIEPTNYHVMSSFGEGTESNLCIWKNGENSANYLIGKKIEVQSLSVKDGMIEVEFVTEAGECRRRNFDCQTANDTQVQINHWTTEKIDLSPAPAETD